MTHLFNYPLPLDYCRVPALRARPPAPPPAQRPCGQVEQGGGGVCCRAAFNIPDAIVCLGAFGASLHPRQSVLLSSHIYIDPPSLNCKPSPTFHPSLFHHVGRQALEVADQSSRGGGCLARVGRAPAQQSFHPPRLPLCFTFHGASPTAPLRPGGGQDWALDVGLGQLPPAAPASCVSPQARQGVELRPSLTRGWKVGSSGGLTPGSMRATCACERWAYPLEL